MKKDFAKHLQDLNLEQVQHVGQAYLKHLTGWQLEHLTKEQVQNIQDVTVLRSLEESARHVTPEQVSKLRTEQYIYLATSEQVAKVPSHHYDKIGKTMLIPIGADMSAIHFDERFIDMRLVDGRQSEVLRYIWLPTKEQVAAISQPSVVRSLARRIVCESQWRPDTYLKETAHIIESLKPEMMQHLPQDLPQAVVQTITNPEAIRQLPASLKAKLTVTSPTQPLQAANRQSVTPATQTVNRQPLAPSPATPKANDKKPSLLRRMASAVWGAFCAIGAFFARLFARCFAKRT